MFSEKQRGARIARREERAYWPYVSDEERREAGCPARQALLIQRRQATSATRGMRPESHARPAPTAQRNRRVEHRSGGSNCSHWSIIQMEIARGEPALQDSPGMGPSNGWSRHGAILPFAIFSASLQIVAGPSVDLDVLTLGQQ